MFMRYAWNVEKKHIDSLQEQKFLFFRPDWINGHLTKYLLNVLYIFKAVSTSLRLVTTEIDTW